jgi:sec-independent protein translocase protein TatA
MPNLRGWEIFILLAIVLLLFGSKKLPDAARGVGRSLRIFKAETKGLMDDDDPNAVTAQAATPPAVETPTSSSATGAAAPGTAASPSASATPTASTEPDRSAPASGPSHT